MRARIVSKQTVCSFLIAALVCACAACGSPPAAAPSSAATVDRDLGPPSIAVTADMGSPHTGDAAPSFELADQTGAKLSLESLRGAVVLLAFVTSWCPFSEAEQPWLAKLAEDYKGKNVKVIAIDIKEDDAGYAAYMKRVAMPLPVLRDTSGEVTLAFTPPGAQPAVKDRSRVLVTSNLVLDRDGKIRFFTMVDTVRFDAKLVHARRVVDDLLAEGSRGAAGEGERPSARDAARETNTWERPGLGGAVRPEMGHPQPGDAAPELELPSARGGAVRLAAFRGSWVVVHFTATWCPYCDAEVEHLGALADAFGDRGVKVLLVDLKEDASLFRRYAGDHVAESVVPLYDASGTTALRWVPPRAQPSFTDRAAVMFDSTVVVDPDGKIRLFLFPDTAHFDPTFRAVREELDRMLTASGRPEPPPLAPEQVVAVSASIARAVPRGGRATIAVDLDVAPGYHLMADRAKRLAETFIPTEVRVATGDGAVADAATFPASVAFHFADRAIPTFRGHTTVSVPIRVEAGAAPGERVLAGSVRYQACTPSRCLMPTTKPFAVRLLVVP